MPYTKITGAMFALGGFTGMVYAHSPRQIAVSLFCYLVGMGLLMYVGYRRQFPR